MKKIFLVFLLALSLSGCSFFSSSTTSTPTQDQQARAVVGFFQGMLPGVLAAGNTFVAAQPQYQSAMPGAIAALSSFNQVLASLEAQGAAGQTITATTVLASLQSQLANIMTIYSTWGKATVSGTTGSTSAQTALLAFVDASVAIQTIDQLIATFSGNYPTWASLQAQNAAFQAQLTPPPPTATITK